MQQPLPSQEKTQGESLMVWKRGQTNRNRKIIIKSTIYLKELFNFVANS